MFARLATIALLAASLGGLTGTAATPSASVGSAVHAVGQSAVAATFLQDLVCTHLKYHFEKC